MRELALTIPGIKGPLEIQAPGQVTTYSLPSILSFATTTLIVIAILLTLFFLISGGINMITSGGDKQKVVNARQKLTYAVIGLIIVLLSFFIVNLIGGVFGVSLFKLPASAPVCNGGVCITP